MIRRVLVREVVGENRERDYVNLVKVAHSKWFLEDENGSDYWV